MKPRAFSRLSWLSCLFLSVVACGGATELPKETDAGDARGSGASPPARLERICTPGNWVFCWIDQGRKEAGTKQCQPDGTSFDDCKPGH